MLLAEANSQEGDLKEGLESYTNSRYSGKEYFKDDYLLKTEVQQKMRKLASEVTLQRNSRLFIEANVYTSSPKIKIADYVLETYIKSSSDGEKKDECQEINVLDVANYFLYRIDREVGDTISPLKLQKLVYYAQAWSLALKDKSIFAEEIEAWVHGPVVYEVWNTFKKYKHNAIPEPEQTLPEFTDEQQEILDEVWDVYGELSARRLEDLTHAELPWRIARQGLDSGEKSRSVIEWEDMKSYYASLLGEKDEKVK